MAKKDNGGIFRVELKGTIRDCHEKFPIKFAYSEKGTAYLIGCRVHVLVSLGNGKDIERRIEVRAFGEVAEELAHVADGSEVHVFGTYEEKQGKDEKWYPVVTIDEIVEA